MRKTYVRIHKTNGIKNTKRTLRQISTLSEVDPRGPPLDVSVLVCASELLGQTFPIPDDPMTPKQNLFHRQLVRYIVATLNAQKSSVKNGEKCDRRNSLVGRV